MVKVEILGGLKKDVLKKFRGDSGKIFRLMKSLEQSPTKGKLVGKVDGVAIKELKYKSFRFYFLVDAFKIRFVDVCGLKNLLIRFVRMSDKKDQQKVINEIKNFLRRLDIKLLS